MNKRSYAEKRAEAIRQLRAYRPALLRKGCNVDTINKAYKLHKQLTLEYNL